MISRGITITGAAVETIHIEGCERVYPCRCGETHRGPYGHYDWGHHNCFHNAPLVPIDADEGYLMCPECGKTFWVAAVRGEKR